MKHFSGKTTTLLTYIFPYFVQKQERKHKDVTNKVCFHDICLLPINHISINNVKKIIIIGHIVAGRVRHSVVGDTSYPLFEWPGIFVTL